MRSFDIEWLMSEAETEEGKWDMVRYVRGELLKDTDWTQLPDAPLTTADQVAYRQYRARLRDLPTDYTLDQITNDLINPPSIKEIRRNG